MPISDEEAFTLVFLLAVVVVGLTVLGWPVDWSTVDLLSLAKLALGPLALASAVSFAGGLREGAEGPLALSLGALTVGGVLVGRRSLGAPAGGTAGPVDPSVCVRLGVLLAMLYPTQYLQRVSSGVLDSPGQALRRAAAEERAREGVDEVVERVEREKEGQWGRWSFSVEEGFFAHDAAEDGLVPSAVMPRLGLLDNSATRWSTLKHAVERLNAEAEKGTSFKLVFVQRHGEGWHNVAERYYGHGSARWCDDYAQRYYADGMVWGPDPELTPAGLEQAADVARAWAVEVDQADARIVLPDVLWASPLKRAAMTMAISYGDVLLSSPTAPQPVIKENLRERIGVHTCDIRPPAYEIETTYGRVRHPANPLNFVLEPGFATHDELWSPTERETDASMDRRARLILSELFATHAERHVALAGHGGIILALFRTVNHKACATPTGAFIPMVIKGVRSPV